MVAVYPSAYLSVTPSFFVVCRAICPFSSIHLLSCLCLSICCMSLDHRPSTHPPALCPFVNWWIRQINGWVMDMWLDGRMGEWMDGNSDTYHSVIHYASICPSAYLPTTLSVHQIIHSTVYLSISYIHTCPPTHQLVYQSACLFIDLSYALTHAPMQPFMHASLYPHTHSSKHLCSFLPA